MREPEHRHRKHVHPKTNNQRMSIIGHISKTLIKVGHRLMWAWKIMQVIVKFDGKHRGALEGTWLPDGRIEIPCFIFL